MGPDRRVARRNHCDAALLESLQAEWETLWSEDPAADVFGSHTWFTNWWKHFGHGDQPAALLAHQESGTFDIPGGDWQLHVCIVRDHEHACVAILPLVRIQGLYQGLRCRILASPVNSHSPRAAILARRFDAGVAATLATALCNGGEWELLLLDGIAVASGRLALLTQALTDLRMRPAASGTWAHVYLPYDGTWSEWLATRTARFRKHLGQSDRALAKLGELVVERLDGADAALRGFELYLTIDRESWKARDGETLDADARLRAYYGELCRRFAAAGQLEVWVPRAGDRRCNLFVPVGWSSALCAQDVLCRKRGRFKSPFAEPGPVGPHRRIDMGDEMRGIDSSADLPLLKVGLRKHRMPGYAVYYRGTRISREWVF
jgi:hypothetical protein